MDVGWLIHTLWVLIIVGIIAGLLYWLASKAPFLPEPFKPIIMWVILAICVIFLIAYVLLPLIGAGYPVVHR